MLALALRSLPPPSYKHLFVEAIDNAGLCIVLRGQRLVLLREPLRHALLFHQPPLQPQLLLGQLVDVLVQQSELLAAGKPGGGKTRRWDGFNLGGRRKGQYVGYHHWGRGGARTCMLNPTPPRTSLHMYVPS